MLRYQFVVGVSLAALEQELNRIVSDEPYTKLVQVFYAQGTGYVAVVERSESAREVVRTERIEQPKETQKNRRRPQTKS